MEQVALNTVIAFMLAIFPGYLFRKFYFSGEFTKQFNQSNEFDKLLWNIFFSGISIGITILSVNIFEKTFGLRVLDSLNYNKVKAIFSTTSKNELPELNVLGSTYKDIIIIVALIYFFSCFFGWMLHLIVRKLRLDLYFRLLRFKNYWFYYFHGGKILFHKTKSRRFSFTKVDILCEFAGNTKLYSGILSQYSISHEDNNLEHIFLTDARSFTQKKDTSGNTIEITSKDIPGATFCIPYKNVVNMNLTYFYEDNSPWNTIKWNKIFDFLLLLFLTFVLASVWFDLSQFGIYGFWRKTLYVIMMFIGLTNFKSLFSKKINDLSDWVPQVLLILTTISYIFNCISDWPNYFTIIFFVVAIIFSSIITPRVNDTLNNDRNSEN